MNKEVIKIILLFFASVLILSCNEIKLEEEASDKYSINLGEFKTYEDADIFKSKLDLQLWRDLKIEQADQNRFLLLYGNYSSAFDAGKNAFVLLSDSLINNYKVVKNLANINDPYSNVLFIAKYQSRPSVYSYNVLKKKSKLIWSRWGRKVLSINHSDDRSSVFILTALGYGKQGGFPYVRDVRLYIYNSEKDQIDEIEEFSNGLQIYSYWENSDTFKVNFTKPDSIHTEKIVQTIFSFDKTGKKTKSVNREFLLTRDGFPKPPLQKLQLFSPAGTYQVRITEDDNKKSIYLRDQKKRAELMIIETEEDIKKLRWSPDEKYIFFILIEKNKPNIVKNELMIINTDEKIVKRTFRGPIFKNLLLQGNLLFFDQQFEGISQITIYDFVTDIIFDEIRIAGGCGINDLIF